MKKTILMLFPFFGLFADGGQSPSGGLTQTFLMIAIALVFFYFILWRPEQKRRKAADQMRGAMKKGDRVTAMGIIGKVDRIQGNTVVLKMIDGSKIEMLVAAVTDVQAASDESSKSESSSDS